MIQKKESKILIINKILDYIKRFGVIVWSVEKIKKVKMQKLYIWKPEE